MDRSGATFMVLKMAATDASTKLKQLNANFLTTSLSCRVNRRNRHQLLTSGPNPATSNRNGGFATRAA